MSSAGEGGGGGALSGAGGVMGCWIVPSGSEEAALTSEWRLGTIEILRGSWGAFRDESLMFALFDETF